ncbi:MAG: hypothetical protein H0V10_03560, partial [Geodermatophilaceae bacterium]|nr:hypothetical protein [Geodermatophilaceae bacterium]
LGFQVAAESPGSPDDPDVRKDPEQLYGGVVFQTNGMLFGLRPRTAGRIARQGLETLAPELR